MTSKPTIPGLSFLPFSDGFDSGFTTTDYSLYISEFNRRCSEFLTNLIPSATQEGHPFTCLVYTLLLHCAARVARGFHLPTAILWTQPFTVFHIFYFYFHGYGDYIKEKANEKDPSLCSIELPGLPSSIAPSDLPSFLLSSASLFQAIVPLLEEQFHELDLETNPRVLVNTSEAFEPETLRTVDKFNVIPIGPLISFDSSSGAGGDIFHGSQGYMEWLDTKPEMSVVYVSFGSLCVLSKVQKEEIARALLDSERPFLWVIREKGKSKFEEKEDEGELSCIEELEQKGKIVKWCSQVEVLSHPSLGCFVTHCGWNSTLESLASGIPMVGFPQWGDQKTNAKLVEDVWKIGVRLDHRVNGNGVVEGKEIRKCLEVVMGSGEKGEELRRNAKKWKSLARDSVKEGGSSEKNLKTFLDDVGQECMGVR